MKKYEIINPSDPYTLEADDLCVAAVAVILLGSGQYALDPVDGEGERVPLFLFGGHEEWWAAHCSETFDAFVDGHGEEIAACLDTVTLEAEERSSLNNIGGRAVKIAERIRANRATLDAETRAPQQVFPR